MRNGRVIDRILTGVEFEGARVLHNRAARSLDDMAFKGRWRGGNREFPPEPVVATAVLA